MTDIIRILDENYGNVIQSLINHQILLDRRLLPREPTSDQALRHEDHVDKPRNRLRGRTRITLRVWRMKRPGSNLVALLKARFVNCILRLGLASREAN